MPDPDLTAYLDGEADAAATARIEARLRDDPELREAALALMRQRVLLARVLPALAAARPVRRRPARPTSRSRSWWLYAAAGAAAAAGLAAVLAVGGTATAPTAIPGPAHADAAPDTPAPLARLADGTTWPPGQRIVCDRPLTATLAAGARLDLEAGSVLLVPAAADGPWRLERGALRCLLPGAQSLALATAQAEMRATGADLRLAADDEGTDLAVRSGTAIATDLLTRTSSTLRAEGTLWLPADTAPPRTVKGAQGRIRGTVRIADARHVELATRFGPFSFTPRWLAERRALDPAMSFQLARLPRGQRVEITWFWEEHLRIAKLRLLAPTTVETLPHREDF